MVFSVPASREDSLIQADKLLPLAGPGSPSECSPFWRYRVFRKYKIIGRGVQKPAKLQLTKVEHSSSSELD